MRKLALLFFFVALLAAPSLAAERHVVLISIDGMMPDYYLKADELGLKIPNLRRLMQEGTYAEGAFSVLPSVTFPSHTTMITGVNPSRHGILNNGVFDPDGSQGGGWYWFYRDLKVITLFDAGRAKGLKTAGVYWPVTVGGPLDMNVPDFPSPNLREAKLLRTVSSGAGLDEVFPTPQSLVGIRDLQRTKVSVHFIRSKPQFMAIHLVDLDGAEHREGPMTPAAFETLERIDGYLGEILDAVRSAGIWGSTWVVIVSDHGFMPIEKQVRPGVLLTSKGLIKLGEGDRVVSWDAMPWAGGGSLAIYLHPQAPAGTAKEVDEIVRFLLSDSNHGVRQAYWSSDLKRMGGFEGAYVVLEAQKGFSFGGGFKGDLVVGTTSRGSHGYPPERPELKASFLVRGPDVNSGNRIGMVRLLDVAPTIARILGLDLGAVEGRVLEEVFR